MVGKGSGVAPKLHKLGAHEKIVQHVFRHAKARVTKDRSNGALDSAALRATKKLEPSMLLHQLCSARIAAAWQGIESKRWRSAGGGRLSIPSALLVPTAVRVFSTT
jgi:hypothetical protein